MYCGNELVINKQNIWCELDNKRIIYKQDTEENIIDLVNKTYNRNTLEYNLKIDFNKNIFELEICNDKNIKIKDNLKCQMNVLNKKIVLEYQIDEENILIIQML